MHGKKHSVFFRGFRGHYHEKIATECAEYTKNKPVCTALCTSVAVIRSSLDVEHRLPGARILIQILVNGLFQAIELRLV